MFSLLRFAKEYRFQMIVGPFFKFLEAVLELFIPIMMAQLIDQGIHQNNMDFVLRKGVVILVISLVGLVSVFICQYLASIASQGFGTNLRNELVKHMHHLSLTDLDHLKEGKMLSLVTSDVNQMQLMLAMLIRLVVRAPFLSLGALIMAFYINSQMAMIFVMVLPIFGLMLWLTIKLTRPMFKKVQRQLDQYIGLITETLGGVRVIRAFGKSQHQKERVMEASDDLARLSIRANRLASLINPLTTLTLNIGIMLILQLSGQQVMIGHMTQGDVLALINYMSQMLLALIIVSQLVVIFTRASASASRIEEVLSMKPSMIDQKTAHPLSAIVQLEANELSFRYGRSKDILKQINLTIKQGEVLGITGPTGSGKSTLGYVLGRLYDADSGHVCINHINIQQYAIQDLRRKIAYVPQDTILFTGTIASNLRIGKPDATIEEMEKALEIAQCLSFVRSLSRGLEAPVVEGGKNFSGGQKQRVAIARALVGQPQLLILDDALSALDYQTDKLLRTALKTELKETMVVVISQRISSIVDADQILVLQEGETVQMGTHQELMRTCSLYKDMVMLQTKAVNA